MANCQDIQNQQQAISNCNNCIIPGTPLWNLFNQENDCEQQLFQSIVEEFTDIAGFPIKFWMSLPEHDDIYGEDATNTYAEPVETRLIYEPSEENGIINAFGFQSDDVLQYTMIPKTTFIRDIGTTFQTYHPSGDIIQPVVGDVITTLWNNRNYEIVDLGSEERIFMGQKHIWEMILRPYRFSEQSDKAREIHLPPNEDDITVIDEEMDNQPGPDEQNYSSDRYGDNSWVEDESDDVDDYNDVDKKIFGL